MPNEQEQRSEAERLLHGLSRLEAPAGLEQRVLSRLRHAQKGGAHRTRHGALHKLTLARMPLVLLVLGVVGIGGVAGIWRERSRMLPPQARSLMGRNLLATPGSSSTASNRSSAIKAGKKPSDSAPGRPSESRTLARLRVSGGWKVEPAQGDFSAQTGDDLRGPNSDAPPENASGQTTKAETIGTAIQGARDFAVPGSPLPKMRTADIPGEPLPLFEIAAAPGTPLPSFTATTTNGDYQ